MTENQGNIDTLLAEVNALADEAVSEILGGQPAETPAKAGPQPRPAGQHTSRRKPAVDPAGQDITRVLDLQVPVIVRLAERTMALSEILNLSTGAIIEFNKPSDSELDLMINNKCVGRGQAVKVGENFGLRVTDIGSLRSRIKALGKP